MNTSNLHNSNDVQSVHGTLIKVFGKGVLLIGKSAVGKSEAALDLVTRTHQIVCDDLVKAEYDADADVVFAKRSVKYPHHISIRGIGLVDVPKTFGPKYAADQCAIDVVVELVRDQPIETFDSVGLETMTYPLLSKELPYYRLPHHPQKHVSPVIEALVRQLGSRKVFGDLEHRDVAKTETQERAS